MDKNFSSIHKCHLNFSHSTVTLLFDRGHQNWHESEKLEWIWHPVMLRWSYLKSEKKLTLMFFARPKFVSLFPLNTIHKLKKKKKMYMIFSMNGVRTNVSTCFEKNLNRKLTKMFATPTLTLAQGHQKWYIGVKLRGGY